MIKTILISAILAAWLVNYTSTPADELIFSDDFDDGTLADRWTFPPTGIDVFEGRVRATDNGRVMRSIEEFSGDVRVELDVEKVGGENHGCWDLGIGFTRTINSQGIIRFDHDGVDAVAVGTSVNEICSRGEFDTVDGGSANSGHVTFTMQNEVLSLEFASDDGNTMRASGPIDVESPYRLAINIAAHQQTPRFIDNLQVFALMNLVGDYDGSGTVEQGDLDLVLLNWGSATPPFPDGWANDLPDGTIDQNELDGVLLNWGDTSGLAAARVPEPSGIVLVVLLAVAAFSTRSGIVLRGGRRVALE